MADLGYLEEYVKEHREKMKNLNLSKIPLVINAYGGPCSGKSTTCLHLVSELKKLGFSAEYVPEYAKELVYEKRYDLLDGSMEHQIDILIEQNKRVDRLVGNVDFIVSDSPIYLSYLYTNPEEFPKGISPFDNNDFLNLISGLDLDYNTFNVFINRNENEFQTEGRIHTLEESKNIDENIEWFLQDMGIFYGTYDHNSVDKILPNCITTFSKLNNLDNDMLISQLKKNDLLNTLSDLKEYCSNEADRYGNWDFWEDKLDALDYVISYCSKQIPSKDFNKKGGKTK